VPTRFVLCTEDRALPADFMRRVVTNRLDIAPDEIASGHCVALSRPKELAALLEGYTLRSDGDESSRKTSSARGPWANRGNARQGAR
jgi:hypothetical protein